MKVAMVVPGGVDRGGTERVIPVLLGMIGRVAREHELHVFAFHQESEAGTWPLRGATVHNAGRPRSAARALRDLVAEHRRRPFAVMHGVWCGPGLVAAAAGRLLRRPALVHLVGGDAAALPEIGYGLLRTPGGRLRLRTVAALAAHLTANSDYNVRLMAARGVRAERVPYGVGVDEWPPLPPRRRRPGAEARLLFVGSLNRVKDPCTLVRGMAALRARGVAFRLDVVGEDLLGGEVHRLAADLGLSSIVHFHGFLPQARLRPLMERADALLVTSRHECGPIVALEAALCGVPTLGTPVGHLADWAPEAAVPFPAGDADALAETAAALLGDEERRLRVAFAAQRRALHDDADRAAARVLDIYRELTRTRERTS